MWPLLPRISEKRRILSKFTGGIFLKEIIIQSRFIAFKNSAKQVVPADTGARIIGIDGIELFLRFCPEFFPEGVFFEFSENLGFSGSYGKDGDQQQTKQNDFFKVHYYSS